EFLREAGRVSADRHRPVPDERFKEPEIVAAVGKIRKQPGGRLIRLALKPEILKNCGIVRFPVRKPHCLPSSLSRPTMLENRLRIGSMIRSSRFSFSFTMEK